MDIEFEKSWERVLKEEFNQPYFKKLTDFIKLEYDQQIIFPEATKIFRAFNLCPFEKVKVVIIGQDPYHTKGMADGLCFSVSSEITKLPPSLKNIFKELESDLGIKQRENGNLISWAEQGVLMINNVLTVREGVADSHAGKGWEQFTDAVIRKLNKHRTDIVYILWGSKAQSKAIGVNNDLNLVLKSPHPSPLSAHRGFFGGKYFSRTNDYLRSKSIQVISW